MQHNHSLGLMFRVFHACLWFVVFLGVLFSRDPRVLFLSVLVMIVGIMLWDVLGYCFVSILENSFTSVQPATPDTEGNPGDVFVYVAKKTNIPSFLFAYSFTLLIFLIYLIGMFRLFRNVKMRTVASSMMR